MRDWPHCHSPNCHSPNSHSPNCHSPNCHSPRPPSPRRAALALVAALAATLLAACGSSPYRPLLDPAPPTATLVRDVQVFTGLDATPLTHRDVLIADGRIASITPTGEPLPPYQREVDGRGRTLLPGFIDAHVHLTSSGAAPGQDVPTDVEHNLHGWLYAGVTTVFDLGGEASAVEEWRERAQSGEIVAPRIYHTHLPITVDDSHPIPLAKALMGPPLSWFVGLVVPTIDSPSDAADVVDDVIDEGVDYVKLTVDELPPGTAEMSDAVLDAAVRAVRARGLRAVVHIGDVHKGRVAVDAGAALLAHLPWRTPVTDDDAAALAKGGAVMTATLGAWHAIAELADGTWKPTPLDLEINPPGLFELPDDTDSSVVTGAFTAAREARTHWNDDVRRMHAAGVVMLVGTDAALPGVYIGGSYHREMRALVDAGLPPAEVLLGATSRAARWIEDDPDFGTVEEGKVADLVLVEGDPLTDIDATTAIVDVWRAGRALGRKVPK